MKPLIAMNTNLGKATILVLLCFHILCLRGQDKSSTLSLIPEPVNVVREAGWFALPTKIKVEMPNNPELKVALSILTGRLSRPTGSKVKVVNKTATGATVRLLLNSSIGSKVKEEGYQLTVNRKQIIIEAPKPAGLFYGIQTLLQLFPPEISGDTARSGISWKIPCVNITDYPRFRWRGMMLDDSRCFFTKEEIMRFIDEMTKYKFNLFHFHLTDDPGWRIEIKGLPQLTDATRGKFHSQEDIAEIVKYAADRFVNILPEIDVPGHSSAVVKVYPGLSRSSEDLKNLHSSGQPITASGNVLNPANADVYTFLKTIITQVSKLFPFDYMHLGGDEVNFRVWEKDSGIKTLMKENGLNNMFEVQNYFMGQARKLAADNGKKMISWMTKEQIARGGITAGSAVMSWQDMETGAIASKAGHEVVMTPFTHVYLDYTQGNPFIEPYIYHMTRLSKTYQFNPLSQGGDSSKILGGQGSLWTQSIKDFRGLEYMAWPRGMAIAETLWSPREQLRWDDFTLRIRNHLKRMDLENINYATSLYEPMVDVARNEKNELEIKLSTEVTGLSIFYTFDSDSLPNNLSAKYTHPLIPPKNADAIKVVSYQGDQKMGRIITMPIEKLEKMISPTKQK